MYCTYCGLYIAATLVYFCLYCTVIILTFAFSASTQLAGCKGAEKGQMGEEDGSFRHHQLEEVGALAMWGGQ